MKAFSETNAAKILYSRNRTLVMGVINVTPDSFSDGGKHLDPEVAVASGLRMIEQGADIVDVGGESTRPGSAPIGLQEELRRVLPVIRGICSARSDAVVSIDTRRSKVASAAIEIGASIVNDVAGFRDDPRSLDVAQEAGAAVVIMHMLGQPNTMQQEIQYHSFPDDIYAFFRERIEFAENKGIPPENIVIDPGIGFGKTFDHNLEILKDLGRFRSLDAPLLVGSSRKAFIGRILDKEVHERDTGTMATVAAAVMNGAHIVRVHNVKQAVETVRVIDAVKRGRIEGASNG